MFDTAIALFGPAHLAALAVIAVSAAAVVLAARMAPGGPVPRRVALALAVLLLLNKLAVYTTIRVTGEFELRDALPMHLCDWSALAAIIALLARWQLPFELAYFWGLGGTLQATLTPDLRFDFPDIRFITFFVSHGGTLVAILFLAIGLRMRPYPMSLVRIFVWSNIYLAAAGTADYLLGSNYGYLRHKPLHPSLLDYLGPWPFYIASLEGIAIVSYLVYYLPFLAIDLVAKRRRKLAAPAANV